MIKKSYLYRVTYEVKRMVPRPGEKWRLFPIQIWVDEKSPDKATKAAYDQLRMDGYNTRFAASAEFMMEDEIYDAD